MARLPMSRSNRRWAAVGALTAGLLLTVFLTSSQPAAAGPADARALQPAAAAAAVPPNVFFYNLDDLRDALPGGVDPLVYMPKVRQWMAAGTRYTQHFVAEPSCCPSRSSLMTGRYPHNNGVRLQSQGPSFDLSHSLACYLQKAGYATYVDGKFLTTWPKTTRPPCFDHSTVMWGGYSNVATRVDGKAKKSTGYSTTMLGTRGREYVTQGLASGKPFLLYETPQAPHWVEVTESNGSVVRRAVPDTKYANANVGTCSGVPEPDRSDKPPYVRKQNFTSAQAQVMCQSQLRAIMTADDEFGATMQLLSDRGALANTLVIFSSDNGYMWGEHGRTEKFVPYDPSLRTPLWLRWPGHVPAATDATRLVSYIDLMPTILAAAGVTPPAGSPAFDGESLLGASKRTTLYAEYWQDPANGQTSTWKMIRTATAKYVQTYNEAGTSVTFREYYNLVADPNELTNLLGDSSTANDPPAATVTAMTNTLNAMATCKGAACVR